MLPPCHKVTEVTAGLWVGGALDLPELLKTQPDILVPLNTCPGSVWSNGWRGEIYYVPIPDLGALPFDVAVESALDILDSLERGKRVAMFCQGGHGRTGYMAALVLGFLEVGEGDPIKYIRKLYCSNAIESNEQVASIAAVLQKPALNKKYARMIDLHYYLADGKTREISTVTSTVTPAPDSTHGPTTCADCASLTAAGQCLVWGAPTKPTAYGCGYWQKEG